MTTATITIKRASVLADMKVKSHAEVARIADATERYMSELGSDKNEEAQQCINDAAAEVTAMLSEFITTATDSSTLTANDDYVGTGDITYALKVYEVSSDFATRMAGAVHDYIVDSALVKFYLSVSRAELSQVHAGKLPAEIAVIKRILYYRPMP